MKSLILAALVATAAGATELPSASVKTLLAKEAGADGLWGTLELIRTPPPADRAASEQSRCRLLSEVRGGDDQPAAGVEVSVYDGFDFVRAHTDESGKASVAFPCSPRLWVTVYWLKEPVNRTHNLRIP